MGTTLQKVQAAQASKEACYDAIIEKGGTITSATKFADYGDAIRSIPAGEVIPDTTAGADHVIVGKTFVKKTNGQAVLETGTLAEATDFYASGADIICRTMGVVMNGSTVYSLSNDATFVSSPQENDGTYITCSTSGYTGAGTTVTHIQQATFTNPEDGNIRCSNAGYTGAGVILTMEEPSGQVITGGSSSATLSFNTPGWVGTYTTFSLDNAGFTATPDYSGNLDIICGTPGYTDSGSTVTTIQGATMSMDYSGGTVFSGEGYASNETLVLEPSTMTASGSTVYATQGYQNGTQYTEVQSGTVTETDSTIEISEGYVQSATYSKGGGGYPVPSGNWSTMTNNETYYAGENGAFVKVLYTGLAYDMYNYFYLYVNDNITQRITHDNATNRYIDVTFYVPPNSSFRCSESHDSYPYTVEYCDATMQQ